MPSTWEKVRLAPFEPVGRLSTLVAAAGRSGLTSLIPALNSGGNGVQDDGQVERPRVSPSMRYLIAQDTTIFIVELDYAISFSWALRD